MRNVLHELHHPRLLLLRCPKLRCTDLRRPDLLDGRRLRLQQAGLRQMPPLPPRACLARIHGSLELRLRFMLLAIELRLHDACVSEPGDVGHREASRAKLASSSARRSQLGPAPQTAVSELQRDDARQDR